MFLSFIGPCHPGYTIVVNGSLSAPVGSYGTFPYGLACVFAGVSTSPLNAA